MRSLCAQGCSLCAQGRSLCALGRSLCAQGRSLSAQGRSLCAACVQLVRTRAQLVRTRAQLVRRRAQLVRRRAQLVRARAQLVRSINSIQVNFCRRCSPMSSAVRRIDALLRLGATWKLERRRPTSEVRVYSVLSTDSWDLRIFFENLGAT